MSRERPGGTIGMAELAVLADRDDPRRRHFRALDRQQQEAAIREMAAAGHGSSTIAAATGFAVEAIQYILGADLPPPERAP